jgi:hypothetical protein
MTICHLALALDKDGTRELAKTELNKSGYIDTSSIETSHPAMLKEARPSKAAAKGVAKQRRKVGALRNRQRKI